MPLPIDEVRVSAGFPSRAADYADKRLDINEYPAGEISAAIIPPPKDRGSTAFIPARKGKAAYRGRREMKRLEREAVAARKREQESNAFSKSSGWNRSGPSVEGPSHNASLDNGLGMSLELPGPGNN